MGVYSDIGVWLRGTIRAEEWCYEDVGSWEVRQAANCDFLLPRNFIKTVLCCS